VWFADALVANESLFRKDELGDGLADANVESVNRALERNLPKCVFTLHIQVGCGERHGSRAACYNWRQRANVFRMCGYYNYRSIQDYGGAVVSDI
jgi:hypothetical protein